MKISEPVRPIGRFHGLSAEGWILNDCSADRSPCWEDPIEAVTMVVRDRLGDFLHSIYLRGSVARGTAVPEVSDLDMLIVYEDEYDAPDWAWSKALAEEIRSRFPFCKGLDLNFLNRTILQERRAGAPYRFMLRTQSVCLVGRDLVPTMPQFKPDPTVMFSLSLLVADLRNAGQTSPGGNKEVCCSLMRRVVRSAGEVAMLYDGRFTRDLGLCVENYLLHARSLRQMSVIPEALSLALQPIEELNHVLTVARLAEKELRAALESRELSQKVAQG